MKYNWLTSIIVTGAIFLVNNALAADSATTAASSIIVRGAPIASIQQQQMQLQNQELDLEQQLLEVKHKLLQLQQDKMVQDINRTAETTQAVDDGFKWIDAKDGKVPDKAVVVAYYKDQPLYVCHADYLEGVHPGQVVKGGCLISYGPKSFIQEKYQVLTGTRKILWESAEALASYQQGLSPYPSYARRDSAPGIFPVKGGFETNRTLYICRVMYGDGIHVGKLVENNCNIGVDNVELRLPTYEILFSYL